MAACILLKHPASPFASLVLSWPLQSMVYDFTPAPFTDNVALTDNDTSHFTQVNASAGGGPGGCAGGKGRVLGSAERVGTSGFAHKAEAGLRTGRDIGLPATSCH